MANITVSDLTIGGKAMPTPAAEGVTITREKIWSSNTGRTSSGKMTGTIVAVKTTVSIKWSLLTPAQAAVVEAAVSDKSNPFVPMTYTDLTGESGTVGATVSRKVYFGTPSYTVYSWAEGFQHLKDVSVDAIEQ